MAINGRDTKEETNTGGRGMIRMTLKRKTVLTYGAEPFLRSRKLRGRRLKNCSALKVHRQLAHPLVKVRLRRGKALRNEEGNELGNGLYY
jgi:hypothetical protein